MVQMLYAYINEEVPLRLEIYLVDDKKKFNLALINTIKFENDALVFWFLKHGVVIHTCEEMFDFEKKLITYESTFSVAESIKVC